MKDCRDRSDKQFLSEIKDALKVWQRLSQRYGDEAENDNIYHDGNWFEAKQITPETICDIFVEKNVVFPGIARVFPQPSVGCQVEILSSFRMRGFFVVGWLLAADLVRYEGPIAILRRLRDGLVATKPQLRYTIAAEFALKALPKPPSHVRERKQQDSAHTAGDRMRNTEVIPWDQDGDERQRREASDERRIGSRLARVRVEDAEDASHS